MPKLSTCADKYQAKAQSKAGGPTFGRKRADVERAEKARQANARAAKLKPGPAWCEQVAGRAKRLTAERAQCAWKVLSLAELHSMLLPQHRRMFAPLTFALPAAQGDLFQWPPAEPEFWPFGKEHAPHPWDASGHTCELPPTDDPAILAWRRACKSWRGLTREGFEHAYREQRLARYRDALKAVHNALRPEFLGEGVSRSVYAFGKHTVIKVPLGAAADCFGANFLELRLWKKYKRRGVIKLAACRLIQFMGVPCLLMQRVYTPGRKSCHKGDMRLSQTPVWAGRLDGNQCGVTARGEWVAYDYGYQPEYKVTAPLDRYEQAEESRRSSRKAEAAE